MNRIDWKILTVRVLVMGIMLLFSSEKCHGQQLIDRDREPDQKIMVLTFGWDSSVNADLIAGHAAWMLRKKLLIGDYEIPVIKDRYHGDRPVVWSNRALLADFFREEGIQWLIGGDITNAGQNPDGERLGPGVFGVAGIPVRCDMHIELFDCVAGQDVWSDTIPVEGHSHRLKVFGINRNPMPEKPAAIEAFIHDSITAVVDRLRIIINGAETGERHPSGE